MSRPDISNLRTWPRNLSPLQRGGLSTLQGGGMSTLSLSLENGGFPSAPGFDLAHVEAINFSVIPVPATAWLFASGLIGLIGIAKRNR